jgi:peroxiredoxin
MSEFLQGGATVVAFFPFAFSGVCDKEMCSFRDGFSRFSNLGAQVVGISVDSVYTLKAFSQTYNLPFPLLSDFNKKVVKSWGVLQDAWTEHGYKGVGKRSVFLVDRNGVLRYRWISETPDKEPPYEDLVKAVGRLA